MTLRQLILEEMDKVPDTFLEEVSDFVRYLQAKSLNEKAEVAVVSESSLRKDWLKPEEDEAWRDL